MLVLSSFPLIALATCSITTMPSTSVPATAEVLLGDNATADAANLTARGADLLHHWAPDELSELQWSPLTDAARQDRQWMEAAYADTPSSTAFELFLQS